MSESTQKQKIMQKNETPTGDSATPLLGLGAQKRQSKDALWTVISLVVHGLVIGGLILFTFTRKPIEEVLNRKREHTVAKERIEKMSEQIRDINREELQKNVMELLDIKASMEAITDQRNADYKPFCYAQIKQKPAQAYEAMQGALENAQKMLDIQRKILPLEKKYADFPNNKDDFTPEQKKIAANMWALRGELSKIQPELENAQEAAYFSSKWLNDDSLGELQKQAWDMSANSRVAWSEATKSLSTMRSANQYILRFRDDFGAVQKRLDGYRASRKEAEDKLKQIAENIPKLEADYNIKKKRYEEAKQLERQSIKQLQKLKKEKANHTEIKKADSAFQKSRKAVKQAHNDLKQSEKTRYYAKKEKGALPNRLKYLDNKIDRDEKSLASFSKRLEDSQKSFTDKKNAWPKEKLSALAITQKMIDLQEESFERLKKVSRTFDVNNSEIQLAQKFPDPIKRQDVFNIDLYALYTTADKLEELIVKEYKDLRAVELSMLRQMVLESAKNNIDTPKPVHPALAKALLVGKPTTTTGLNEQKEAIRIALAEGDKMQEYCQSLLDSLMVEQQEITVTSEQVEEQQEDQTEVVEQPVTTQELSEEEQKELVQEIVKQVTQQITQVTEKTVEVQKKTEIAKVDDKAEKKETTEADKTAKDSVKELEEIKKELQEIVDMKKVEVIPQTLEKVSKKLEEIVKLEKVAEKKTQQKKEKEQKKEIKDKLEKAEKKAKDAAMAASEAVKEIQQVAQAVKELSEQSTEQQQAMNQTQAAVLKAKMLADASSGATAKAADISKLMKAQAKSLFKTDLTKVMNKGAPHPLITKNTDGMKWGRMITSTEGGNAKWLLINSWHSIGPWPNPNRRNRERKFPPENSVDLDATYVGIDDKPIKWQYVEPVSKQHKALVEPFVPMSYAIYYFYTEVRSDKERDVWMATGSDDKAKIWVNDMLVWESAPYHKIWSIGEGYRKIHLKEGVNKILYRLENGWHGTGMSMALYLEPGF